MSLTTTQSTFEVCVVGDFTDEERKMMEGARTFPAKKITKKAKKSKKVKKVKQPSAIKVFKENCVEDFVEQRVEGWTQVDAPWGECYASGHFIDKKFINEASAEMVAALPKKHFLTWEAAVEFAEKTEECEAITKTTAGYELRKFRCAIKNTPSGFKGGLRTWLRDYPYDCEKTYAELTTTEDAHIRVKTPAQAKKIAKINADAADEWVNRDVDAETDVEEEEEKFVTEEAEPVEEEEQDPAALAKVVAQVKILNAENDKPLEDRMEEAELKKAVEEVEVVTEPVEEVEVDEKIVDGTTYYYDEGTNTLYDYETNQEIGTLREDGNIDYA